jgi:hypothetical protein
MHPALRPGGSTGRVVIVVVALAALAYVYELRAAYSRRLDSLGAEWSTGGIDVSTWGIEPYYVFGLEGRSRGRRVYTRLPEGAFVSHAVVTLPDVGKLAWRDEHGNAADGPDAGSPLTVLYVRAACVGVRRQR